jgi:hypothetical protein
MGLLARFKVSHVYDKVLAARGVHPRSIPPSLNAAICSYATQQYEWANFGGSMDLEATVCNAAEHAACCLLGPSQYRRNGGYAEFSEIDRIAGDWKARGSESTYETMIVRAINDEGLLHSEYVHIFKSHL